MSPKFVCKKLNMDLPLTTATSLINLVNQRTGDNMANSSNMKNRAADKASFISNQSLISSTMEKNTLQLQAEPKQSTLRLLQK